MKVIQIKIYDFAELSNTAKERANLDYHSEGHQNPWNDDNINSYKEFCNLFNVRDTGRAYGEQIDIQHDDEVKELSGIRLLAYLWNNYGHILWKGKYYSLWSKTEPGRTPHMGKLKHRYSKVILQDKNCNLTGYCMDESLLQPFYEFMEKPDSRTFEDLIQEAVESWSDAMREEEEHYRSIEYFAELAECNNWQFTESGEFYS